MTTTRTAHTKAFAAMALFTLLAPDLAAAKVTVDYDPSLEFPQYKTYFMRSAEAGGDSPTEQRIEDAVVEQLESKGLVRVQEGGELEVAIHVAKSQELQVDTYEAFPHRWHRRAWRGYGWGLIDTIDIREVTVGTVVVDLIDHDTGEIVWRGSASGEPRAKAEKNAKKVDKAVARMFKQFPPAS